MKKMTPGEEMSHVLGNHGMRIYCFQEAQKRRRNGRAYLQMLLRSKRDDGKVL